MGRTALGDLEHQVLLATLRLRPAAYSVSVVMEISEQTGREVAQSAVFIALRRLEEKGLLQSRVEENVSGKSRVRRYFEPTPAGLERLKQTRKALVRLWNGVAAELDGVQ